MYGTYFRNRHLNFPAKMYCVHIFNYYVPAIFKMSHHFFKWVTLLRVANSKKKKNGFSNWKNQINSIRFSFCHELAPLTFISTCVNVSCMAWKASDFIFTEIRSSRIQVFTQVDYLHEKRFFSCRFNQKMKFW